jgi:hypothetical protein
MMTQRASGSCWTQQATIDTTIGIDSGRVDVEFYEMADKVEH